MARRFLFSRVRRAENGFGGHEVRNPEREVVLAEIRESLEADPDVRAYRIFRDLIWTGSP